jgi:hypothetical protein
MEQNKMAWNLNNKPNNYSLSGRLTGTLIDMYGIKARFYKSNLVGSDNIFNESQHISLETANAFDVFVYPENADAFESDDILSKFGMMSMSTTNLFISAKSVSKILSNNGDNQDVMSLVGGVVKLPSDKMLEVTNIDIMTDGLNNMFMYKNQKNCYTLICRPHAYSFDEIDNDIKQEMDFNDDNDIVPDMSYVFGIDHTAGDTLTQVKQESTIPASQDMDPVFGRLG